MSQLVQGQLHTNNLAIDESQLSSTQIDMLERAYRYEQEKNWGQAEDIYRVLLQDELVVDGEQVIFSSHAIERKLVHVLSHSYAWEDIEKRAQALLSASEEDADMWALLGRALIELNRIHDGLRACKMALMLNKEHYGAQVSVARAFIHRHEWEKARNTCNSLLRIEETSEVMALAGFVELQEGDMSLALDMFTQAIELDPSNAEAYVFRAVLSIHTHKWHTMLVNLESALRMKADSAAMQKLIIMLLIEQEFYDEAEQCISLMIDYMPKQVMLYVNWAHILRLSRNYQDSLAVLERALMMDNNLSAAWVGFIETSLDEYPAQLEQLIDRVVSNSPDNVRLLAYCAHTAFGHERYDIVRRLIARIRKIEANNAVAASIEHRLLHLGDKAVA